MTPSPASAPSNDRFSGLHPLLFAAYPVLFLWSANLGEVDPIDAIVPLVVIVSIAAATTWILGRVLHDRRRGAIIATTLAITMLNFGHVEELLEGTPIALNIRLIALVVLVVLSAILAIRLGARWVTTLDRLLLALSGALVAVSLLAIVPFYALDAVGGPVEATSRREPVGTETAAQKRDVYWLVLDRYGSDRSLDLRFGAHNDLTPWLREHGFTVLDDSHANYVRTAFSMASTLNLTHFDELAAKRGPDDKDISGVHRMLQDSLVARQFKALGYRYLHIGSWWDPTRTDRSADVDLNLPGASDFLDALYDQTALPAVARRIGITRDGPGGPYRHYDHNVFALDTLDGIRDEPGPKFVHAHFLLPHPPYVFDRDGSFLEESDDLSESERFQRQLDYANTRLRAFLEPLLALPESERPIIILQADEGPYTVPFGEDLDGYDWTTATEDELEMKFGILNAWNLPGDADLGLYPTMTAVNTFPRLFREYFGLDYDDLEDSVQAANEGRPYDLIDIRDRLPSLR